MSLKIRSLSLLDPMLEYNKYYVISVLFLLFCKKELLPDLFFLHFILNIDTCFIIIDASFIIVISIAVVDIIRLY